MNPAMLTTLRLHLAGKTQLPSLPAGGRSRGIDCVRGVAILLVIGCHFVQAPDSAGVLSPLAQAWYRIGWAGVDLFFVLSGFLVSSLWFAEFQRRQQVDFGRFLLRRCLKIWPAYFAYLAFLAVWLAWKSRPGGAETASLWPNLLHVQNYLGTPRIHTWSLALEEHFYLIGALLAASCLTPSRVPWVRRFFILAAGMAVTTVAVARHVAFLQSGPTGLNLFATHLRFDGLLMGALLAYCTHFEPSRLAALRRHPRITTLTGIALAAPMMVLTPDRSAWTAGAGLAVMYIGFALVVAGIVFLEKEKITAQSARVGIPLRLLSWVGFFSYGIYLWHVDLAQTPMKKLAEILGRTTLPNEMVWAVSTTAYVAMAVLAGALMSRLIELPVLALRDRWFPAAASPGGALPVGAAPSTNACDATGLDVAQPAVS